MRKKLFSASIVFAFFFGVLTPGASAQVAPPTVNLECGVVTCTKYFSRTLTREMDSIVQGEINRINNVSTAALGGICGVAAAPLGGQAAAGAAAVCSVAGGAQVGDFYDTLHNAAVANQCFAITSAPPETPQYAIYGSDYKVRSNEHCVDY